jgi:hypothetical protein
MKFKWIGGNGFKDIDLVLYKIMTPNQLLVKGTVIDVPDDNTELIQRIKLNANYEEYVEPKKVIKPSLKKEKKETKKEEE